MNPASRGRHLEESSQELDASNAAQEQANQTDDSRYFLQQQLPTGTQHTLPQHLRTQSDQGAETNSSSVSWSSLQPQRTFQWQGAQNVMTPTLNMTDKQIQASNSSQRTFQPLSGRQQSVPSPTQMDPSTLALWQHIQPNDVQYEHHPNYFSFQGRPNQFSDNMIQVNMNSDAHEPLPLSLLQQYSTLRSIQGETPSMTALPDQHPMPGIPFQVDMARFIQNFASIDQSSDALMHEAGLGLGQNETFPSMQRMQSQQPKQDSIQESHLQSAQVAAKRPPPTTLLDHSESSHHNLSTKLPASVSTNNNERRPSGSKSVRNKKAPPSDPQTSKVGAHTKQNHVTSFPGKLMQALMKHGRDDIVAWLPDGKSFVIVNPNSFCSQVLGKVFKETKYSSFVRKLHRWGFVRLTSGVGTDCFHHPQFQRNKIELAGKITSSSKHVKDKDMKSHVKPPSLAGVEKFIHTQLAARPISESVQRLQDSQRGTESPTDSMPK